MGGSLGDQETDLTLAQGEVNSRALQVTSPIGRQLREKLNGGVAGGGG